MARESFGSALALGFPRVFPPTLSLMVDCRTESCSPLLPGRLSHQRPFGRFTPQYNHTSSHFVSDLANGGELVGALSSRKLPFEFILDGLLLLLLVKILFT